MFVLFVFLFVSVTEIFPSKYFRTVCLCLMAGLYLETSTTLLKLMPI